MNAAFTQRYVPHLRTSRGCPHTRARISNVVCILISPPIPSNHLKEPIGSIYFSCLYYPPPPPGYIFVVCRTPNAINEHTKTVHLFCPRWMKKSTTQTPQCTHLDRTIAPPGREEGCSATATAATTGAPHQAESEAVADIANINRNHHHHVQTEAAAAAVSVVS